MKQQTLDAFVRPTKSGRAPSSYTTAKETLEPLFVRPIPEATAYRQQLETEYSLIDANHFVPVFLQVCTILELIRLLGEETGRPIPHIIRGSAGSSLVCFLLGITELDPLLHKIQLARFMNVLRKDMPDIDIDVPYNRREELYGRIATTWPGMVARISNYCLWTEKTALRECIKEVFREQGASVPRAVHRKHFDAAKLVDASTLQSVKEKAAQKVGTLKQYSKHCGGIVIFEQERAVPEELVLKPLEANGKPLVQLSLNKDDTEDRGFIKIDILSNRGLAQLAEICPERPLTWYPVRNNATERIFEKGWNLGITFGESRGMRKLFMEMRPRNVKEIAIALALIRPAAAAEGRKQEFLEKWKLGHRDDPLLRPIIFDDDAIDKIQCALHCSAAEADRWRKVFAKQNAQGRVEFRQQMAATGHSQSVIDSIVDDLNQLQYYSFCKSHAFSYAQLVWALAYWKAHRPHAFWAAALNHCHSEYRKWVHYREARCAGLHLSSSPPPYTVGIRQGCPALISQKGEQTRLCELSPVQELHELGYWTSEAFLPSCGLWKDAQQRLDGKQTCQFRGIIATGRTVTRDWGSCTLLCLGIENRVYLDIVVPNAHRSDLFRYAILEGRGILTRELTVEVSSIHGVSLRKLSKEK